MQETKCPLSFLDLDYDIRLMIYHELLFRSTPISLYFSQRKIGQPQRVALVPRPPLPYHPQILRTCKQVYNEAMPLLYGLNEFQFFLSYGNDIVPRVSHFIEYIGHHQAKCLRRIILTRSLGSPTESIGSDLNIMTRAELENLAQSTNVMRLTLGFREEDSDLVQCWIPQIREIFFGGEEGGVQSRIQEAHSRRRLNTFSRQCTHTMTRTSS